jgi:hypothetical protein
MDTFVEHPAMVCVQESYLRENVFANPFPRSGPHVTIYVKWRKKYRRTIIEEDKAHS